jgi:hypothetical protein
MINPPNTQNNQNLTHIKLDSNHKPNFTPKKKKITIKTQ